MVTETTRKSDNSRLTARGFWPWHVLQRHPLTVRAHFVRALVLTYAFPREHLGTLLPPGLQVDTHGAWGFVAVALVQTERLRPTVLPRALGQAFFLAGYRIFTTFKPAGGRTLRGLYILRSDTDRRLMAVAGNLLTHYRYQLSQVEASATSATFTCRVRTRQHAADLELTADLRGPAALPATTPFATLHEARRFAGPLPYTFDHEPETDSIIVIKAQRQHWEPRVVPVTVRTLTFFEHGAWAGLRPRLASAFFVEDIDYQWNRGVRYRLT